MFLSDFFASLKDGFFGLFSRGGKKEYSQVGDTRLYIGNLSYQAREEDLKQLFSKYGLVREVNLVRDRFSKKPKGYAFIEMPSVEADKALALNGNEFFGRRLIVSRAKSKNSGGPSRRPNSRPRQGRWKNKSSFRPFYARGFERSHEQQKPPSGNP